jgi:hypothetical protein
MLPEQSSGLLGGWHLSNPVGNHLTVIEKLEERIVGSSVLFMSQDRDTVAAVADNQVSPEAPIQIPSGAGEAVFYLFRGHFSTSFPRSRLRLACSP